MIRAQLPHIESLNFMIERSRLEEVYVTTCQKRFMFNDGLVQITCVGVMKKLIMKALVHAIYC